MLKSTKEVCCDALLAENLKVCSDKSASYNGYLRIAKLIMQKGLLVKKKKKGRQKIKIEYIQDRARRNITFTKRKAGIMKKVLFTNNPISNFKAFEMAKLTGSEVLLVIADDHKHIFSFATPKLHPVVNSEPGQSLIKVPL